MRQFNVMLFFLIITSLFVAPKILAQGPPPPAEPTNDNKILIDKLIEVSSYKVYFQTICMEKIKEANKQDNWKASKKNKIIESINFEHFDFTIYNSWAHHSKEDLERVIRKTERLNKKNKKLFNIDFISNPIIEKNLEGYLENLIAGKYVIPSKY